jgi:hypothetical protein
VSKNNKTHGLSRTPLYTSWQAMLSRCFNPNIPDYQRYGKIGRTVCQFLKESPQNLILLISERPRGKTLDRIDNEGHYSCGACEECKSNGWPLNVRWATPLEQTRNSRHNTKLTIGVSTRCIAEWAEIAGIGCNAIIYRLRARWPEADLLRPSNRSSPRHYARKH